MSIRAYLEAIRDRHSLENVGSDSHLCIWCGSSDYPCHDREDAVAALRDLDNAPLEYLGRGRLVGTKRDPVRLVPDPVAAATSLSAAENLGGLIGHPSPPSGT